MGLSSPQALKPRLAAPSETTSRDASDLTEADPNPERLFNAALIGLAIEHGKFSLDRKGLFPQWAGDVRAEGAGIRYAFFRIVS
jgi:hypothetical protein